MSGREKKGILAPPQGQRWGDVHVGGFWLQRNGTSDQCQVISSLSALSLTLGHHLHIPEPPVADTPTGRPILDCSILVVKVSLPCQGHILIGGLCFRLHQCMFNSSSLTPLPFFLFTNPLLSNLLYFSGFAEYLFMFVRWGSHLIPHKLLTASWLYAARTK